MRVLIVLRVATILSWVLIAEKLIQLRAPFLNAVNLLVSEIISIFFSFLATNKINAFNRVINALLFCRKWGLRQGAVESSIAEAYKELLKLDNDLSTIFLTFLTASKKAA